MTISSFYLYKLVKKRLHGILKSVKNLARDEPDFSKRLSVKYNDEISNLTKWINNLSTKFEDNYNELDILNLYDFGTGLKRYKGKFCFEISDYANGLDLLNVRILKEKFSSR